MKRETYLNRKLRISKRNKSDLHVDSLRIIFFKSNKHFYASLVENATGNVLFTVTTCGSPVSKDPSNIRISQLASAFSAKAKNIDMVNVIFDRGVYRFHGLVKSFVEKIREEGIKV